MDPAQPGERVNVAGVGGVSPGIVFDTPSATKVVVAVLDGARGPVFRTVHATALTGRTDEGADDPALRLLIRRTPPPARGAGDGGAGVGHRLVGHARGSMHRTTGK
jgi:hypothetical protein